MRCASEEICEMLWKLRLVFAGTSVTPLTFVNDAYCDILGRPESNSWGPKFLERFRKGRPAARHIVWTIRT
jgi:hypothetical protein